MPATLLDRARDHTLVVAHRGASRAAPENTIAAFEAAIDMGCDAIELDVRRTGDATLVVHHAPVRRGHALARMSYAELVARSRHVPPRLETVLDLCATRIALDVELKEQGYEDVVVALLAQRFPAEGLLITSFHDSVVATVKRLHPSLPCGLLIGPARMRRDAESPLERAMRCGADAILPHQVLLGVHAGRLRRSAGALLARSSAAGLPVLVWTVNGARRMERFLSDQRVAGIITDVPDVAAELRARLPRPVPPTPV